MEASMPPNETLVIVDDEPLMTDVFSQFMTKRGFRVLTAASGKEALATVAAEAGAIRLVITDMTMPDMTGVEVARHLYRKNPNLPVVIITGHDLDPAQLGLTPNVKEIVRKPCLPRAFADRIRAILDSTNGGS